MSETTNVFAFVYGTLRPDGWNHRLIEQYVRHAVPATAKGILVDLGTIPALIPGDGLVRGVLLTVDSAAIARMDKLEGVPHFYRRTITTVTFDDGSTTDAWVYEYADPIRIADRPKLLVGYEHGLPVFSWSSPHLL